MLHHIFTKSYMLLKREDCIFWISISFTAWGNTSLINTCNERRLDTQIKWAIVCRMEKLLNAHSFI